LETVKIREKLIDKIPTAARRIDRVGRSIKDGPVGRDELFPGLRIPGHAGLCQRQIFGIGRIGMFRIRHVQIIDAVNLSADVT
jgi:hypothetical protein